MITLNNISKTYGNDDTRVEALKNINLNIEDAKLTAIVGQSGSGKSTLINIIGAILEPTEGQVIVDGKDITKLSKNELCEYRNKNVGFVFQSYFLEPNFTVLQNTIMPLVISGEVKKAREEKAKDILMKLGLENKINKKAKELSGGEKQRVSIARALINNPKIIICDEPTGNLDKTTGDNVMNILKSLADEGHTILLVTHNFEYAKMADRIIHIEDGEIKEL